jgi:hypothetical protein
MVMKAFIYIALVVAFIVIFQQNPLMGIILIAIVGGGYIFIKSRKKNGGMGIFRSGRGGSIQDTTQHLLTYMLLQQLSGNNASRPSPHESEINDGEIMNEHDKARYELLKILE